MSPCNRVMRNGALHEDAIAIQLMIKCGAFGYRTGYLVMPCLLLFFCASANPNKIRAHTHCDTARMIGPAAHEWAFPFPLVAKGARRAPRTVRGACPSASKPSDRVGT